MPRRLSARSRDSFLNGKKIRVVGDVVASVGRSPPPPTGRSNDDGCGLRRRVVFLSVGAGAVLDVTPLALPLPRFSRRVGLV